MNFVDHVTLFLHAGKGGDGVVSFEKGIKGLPRPDGGNGGKGGDICIISDNSLSSLDHLQNNQTIIANNGVNGGRLNSTGAQGKTQIIMVPCGTSIKKSNGETVAFLSSDNKKIIVAKGGHGGKGNHAFVSNHNRAPVSFEVGANGEELSISLEMQVIADVGIVGLPTVGKTTFLNKISFTEYKVGEYDFTTLHPNLGMAYFHDSAYKFCDVPGIIRDAHLNKGLGLYFLKHITLCKILLYVVAYQGDFTDFCNQFKIVREEINYYDPKTVKKPSLVIINNFQTISISAQQNILNFFQEYHIGTENCFFYNLLDESLDFSKFYQAMIKLLGYDQTDKSLSAYYSGVNCKTVTVDHIDPWVNITKLSDNEYQLTGAIIDHLSNKYPLTNHDNFVIIMNKLKRLRLWKIFREAGVKNFDFVWINQDKYSFTY